jgi:hypothetical protein
MNFKDKSQSLAEKMNRLTAKFADNLETAEEMVLTGDDIVEYVEEKTQDIQLYEEAGMPAVEIINLNNMVEDFRYVRETLRENTDNGRRVLNSVTLDLLDGDDDKRASLIMSFAELNKAVADNMKLYIQSYKEISNVLLNLDKIKKAEKANAPQTINNTLNINSTETISTVDLIKRLTNKGDKNV